MKSDEDEGARPKSEDDENTQEQKSSEKLKEEGQ
jgi:hypothetical protein